MKLYSVAPQDCSGKVRWLLNEMNVPFEDMQLNYKNGDTKSADYLTKQPVGQVPALEDGDFTIYESYAIVSYLADKYLDKGMAPDPKDIKKRGEYYQWMFFATDTAEDFFNRFEKLPKMNEEYQKQWGEHIKDKVQKILMTIDKQLAGKDYLLGKFSAVDTCMGYALDGICDEPFFKDYPNVRNYFQRLQDREACKKSQIFKRN